MTARLASLVLAAGLGLAALAPPRAARADQAEDEAAALMNAAADAYQKGDYQTCRAKASDAWAKFQHAQIAGLLGSCEVKLGMYPEGATHLDFYLKSSTGEVNADAKQLLEEAKQHVSEVTLACHPEGVVFKIDQRPMGAGNETVFLTPGPHVISAEKPGYEPKQASQATAAGTKVTVNLTLEPVKVHRSIVPGVVTLSVGAVALAVGGGLLGLHASQMSDGRVMASKCTMGSTKDCNGLADQARAATMSGNAGEGVMIGGGVVAAAGAGLLIWELMGGSSQRPAEPGAVAVLPAIGRDVRGLVIEGSFR